MSEIMDWLGFGPSDLRAPLTGRVAEMRELDKALEAATNYKPNKADWLEGKWAGFTVAPGEEDRKGVTAVDLDRLKAVGRAISEPPSLLASGRPMT